MLNDKYISGKENDLSAFGIIDDRDYKNITIKALGKSVKVLLADKVIFKEEYAETMGRLVGVRFKFLGSGEVKNVQITDSQGDIFF